MSRNMEGYMLSNSRVANQSLQPRIRITRLVWQISKHSIIITSITSLRQPPQSIIRKRNPDRLASLLHRSLQLHVAILTYCDLAPLHLVHIRKPQPTETAKQKCRLHIVLRTIVQINNLLHFLQSQETSALLLRMRLQLPVNILSGILDNDSIPLRLIQCNHDSSKQSLLINLAERFRLSICILAILI